MWIQNDSYVLRITRRKTQQDLSGVQQQLNYYNNELDRIFPTLFSEPEPAKHWIKRTMIVEGVDGVAGSLYYHGDEKGPWHIKGSPMLMDIEVRNKHIEDLLHCCRKISYYEDRQEALIQEMDELHQDIACECNKKFHLWKKHRTAEDERQDFEQQMQER